MLIITPSFYFVNTFFTFFCKNFAKYCFLWYIIVLGGVHEMKITDTKHRLKELLNETRDTQNEMARKSGLTKSAISNYLNGTREPRQDAIYKRPLVHHRR